MASGFFDKRGEHLYINPFGPTRGHDERPDFVPGAYYLHVKDLCNQACFRVYFKDSIVYSLEELTQFIDDYEDLFEHTELFVRFYAAFEEFSHMYLALCENKVFIEDYGPLCKKAIMNFERMELLEWLNTYERDYTAVRQKLEWHETCDCKIEGIMKINSSAVHVYTKEIEQQIAFFELFNQHKPEGFVETSFAII